MRNSSVSSLSSFSPVGRLRIPAAVGVLGLVAALGLLSAPAAHAQQTVNYSNQGTITSGNTFTSGGVTVTSPGTIDLAPNQGLAIVGGLTLGGDLIDNGESALFTFTGGPATAVTVRLASGSASSPGTATTLEAFGSGGGSLGVFTYFSINDRGFLSNSNLSGRVNNAPISAFRISGGANSGASVASITFTPAAVTAVPEPSEWLAMGMAGTSVMGLMVRARRKSRKGSATVVAA